MRTVLVNAECNLFENVLYFMESWEMFWSNDEENLFAILFRFKWFSVLHFILNIGFLGWYREADIFRM